MRHTGLLVSYLGESNVHETMSMAENELTEAQDAMTAKMKTRVILQEGTYSKKWQTY